MARRTFAAFALVLAGGLAGGGIATAQAPAPEQESATGAPAQAIPFREFVERAVKGVIVPGYAGLSFSLTVRTQSFADLCGRADAEALAKAREEFALIVTAWSRVEMFRFGPARTDNRQERMFFWPDRRGAGLRQVQGILADADESVTAVDTLRAKSVAVQGLPALEYVLYGDGSETLAAGTPLAFRCRYGLAIVGALAETARQMAEDWNSPTGYASLMLDAGPENPVYRSHGEVTQEILRAAREQLQLVRDLKLAMPIGDSPADAKPRLAPFWRSNQTLASVRANIATVLALINTGGIGDILPADWRWLDGSLAFELGRADGALRDEPSGKPFESLVRDPAAYGLLAYSLIPLAGAIDLLENSFPDALGLTAGFNALDGD